MNSERIRQEFGSFGIDVLECSVERRVSSLHSFEHGLKVCRTYAVVEFTGMSGPDLAEEHDRVQAGESIGAVFKAGGWSITKRHVGIGRRMLLPADTEIVSLMRLGQPRPVAWHSYIFEVYKGPSRFDYASITELHHPDYLSEADLRQIYGVPQTSRGNPLSVQRHTGFST